jgi:hypothetical protein
VEELVAEEAARAAAGAAATADTAPEAEPPPGGVEIAPPGPDAGGRS